MTDPLVDVPEPSDRKGREEEIRKAADLMQQFDGDPDRLALIAAQFWMAARGRAGEDGLYVSSGVAASPPHDGFVQVTWGEKRAQITPEVARQTAINFLEVAEAAISDAAIYRWGQLMGSRERAAQLVQAIREEREGNDGDPD